MSHHQLDARRLLCPLPVIRTQNKVRDLLSGDILEIICTDPGVVHDIPTWCRINGHRVLTIQEDKSDIIITIQVEKDLL